MSHLPQQFIAFKLVNTKGQIKRIHDTNYPCSLESITEKALAHENTSEEVRFSYTDDDGDVIAIDGADDWNTALEWANAHGKALKLTINVSEKIKQVV